MKIKLGVKEIVAIGIGTALFVVLTEVQIPLGIVRNVSLQPRMAVLAFLSAVFGPVAGTVTGLLGHALGDFIYYNNIYWGWVIAEGIVGFAIGSVADRFKVEQGGFDRSKVVLFNIVQIVANAAAWIVAAPLIQIAIYKISGEEANIGEMFAQGAFAFLGDIIVVGLLGSVLLKLCSNIFGREKDDLKE